MFDTAAKGSRIIQTVDLVKSGLPAGKDHKQLILVNIQFLDPVAGVHIRLERCDFFQLFILNINDLDRVILHAVYIPAVRLYKVTLIHALLLHIRGGMLYIPGGSILGICHIRIIRRCTISSGLRNVIVYHLFLGSIEQLINLRIAGCHMIPLKRSLRLAVFILRFCITVWLCLCNGCDIRLFCLVSGHIAGMKHAASDPSDHNDKCNRCSHLNHPADLLAALSALDCFCIILFFLQTSYHILRQQRIRYLLLLSRQLDLSLQFVL